MKVLQRGRAHVSAESEMSMSLLASHTDNLQRGRAHVSAESSFPNNIASPIIIPSTGPRSRERGEAEKAKVADKEKMPSTGPRSRERGEERIRLRRHCILHPFNGGA